MNLLEGLQWRYATKKFDAGKKISEADFRELVVGTNLTASSLGLQAYKLINVTNADTRQLLVEASYGQDKVATASHLLVFATKTDLPKAIDKYVARATEVRSLTEEQAGQMRAWLNSYLEGKSEEALHAWLARQPYIAMGNLLTLCALKKIDACPMEGFNNSQYDEILGLKELGLTSTLVVPIGYRAADDEFAQIKKVRQANSQFVIEI